jgi:hypothetical protein
MSTIHEGFTGIQKSMYSQLRSFSIDHDVGARILSLPISFGDTLIQTVKPPLMAIELVASAALNTIGFLFSEDYSIKNALKYSYVALHFTIITPLYILTAPLNFVYQFFKSLSDPQNASSIKDLIEQPKPFFIDVRKNVHSKVESLYDSFRPFAESHSLIGRALAVPLAFTDVFLETFKTPLIAIEAAASAVFNLLGMLFLQSCSFEQAYVSTLTALAFSAHTIVALATCPLKFIDQAIANLYDPMHATAFHKR